MKFIHTADLHIGKSRTLPDYLERQEMMLDSIFKVAEEQDVDAILMAGDIFESKNIRWSEQRAFMERLFTYDAKGHATVLCNGNHDELATGVSHMWLPSMINDFGGLSNTTIIDGESRLVQRSDVHIGVLPVVPHNMTTKELSDAVAKLYEKADDELPFVVMMHACISGSNTDTGMSLSGGPRIPKDCDFVDYWALGDIHKSQQMASKAWYSGAPMQHDFGDLQPKGVLVVEIEKGGAPKVELVELEGIKPLVTVTEIPEEWPTDCYIRFMGSMASVVNLPDNVIKTQGVIQDDEETDAVHVETEFGDSLTEGLVDYLRAKGVPKSLQGAGVKWVEDKYCK